VALLMTVALGSGLSQFETESRPEKLFVPEGTQALVDQVDILEYYGDETRLINFMIQPVAGSNVLMENVLGAVFDFWSEIEGINNNQLASICLTVPTPAGPQCIVSSVLTAWLYNKTTFENDGDYIATMNNRIPNLESLLGGIERIAGQVVSAEALRFIVLIESQKNTTDDLEDIIVDTWEETMLDIALNDPPISSRSWSETINVYPFCSVAFSQEVGGAITSDVPYQSASYLIIIIYVIIMLQTSCDRVKGSVAIALLGICSIGLGIVSAFGLAQYLNIPYGNTHTILPFIILGVGVDGCFILVNDFNRTLRTLSLSERSATALSQAGVSLTVTSMTNVAAFAIGSLTVIPDLSSFCKYAAMAQLFLWFYHITFFMACLVLNQRRISKRKLDVLCCLPDCRKNMEEETEEFKPSRMSQWMRNTYAPLITQNITRALVGVVALGWIAFSCYNISKLTVQATGTNFIPDGSYLKTNLDLQAEFFSGSSTDVFVVTKAFDYFELRESFATLPNQFRGVENSVPYIKNGFEFWFDVFIADLTLVSDGSVVTSWNVSASEVALDSKLQNRLFPLTSQLFYSYLQKWLLDAGLGKQFSSDLVFENSLLIRSRVQMEHPAIGDFDDNGKFIKEDPKRIVKAVEKMYEICNSFPFPVYPYSFNYVNDWASFAIIEGELIQNVALALLAVFVVTMLLIGHPGTSIMVFLSVCITIVELLGIQTLFDLSIDTVAVVLFVLAVGLSVDYSAHIAQGFMQHHGTRKERVCKVMGDIGVPVFNGAVSTFLAVCLQGLSKSYVFRVVFLDFFFAILFGLLNGIVLLPMALSVIGPMPYNSNKISSEKLQQPSL